ncbi:hypothetical protein GF389_04440 [Candidatus Dojkabacteria bacterium]|nr:hypothetical protein [Candidatus Dojkabacteria bacterium]
MKISTRTRAIVLALAISIVFFVFQGVDFLEALKIDFEFDFIKMAILAGIMYIGLWWVVNFRVRGERFITVLLFPALATFVFTLYVNLLIESILSSVDKVIGELFASFVVATFSYILILTANILNVGYLEKVPLTQAGRAAHYVLTLVTAYLFFSLLFSNPIPFIVKVTAVFGLSYLFSIISLWNIEIKYYQRVLASFGIGLMMGICSFVLIMWPVGSDYVALILSLLYYMTLGLALEVREVLSSRVWVEYFFLYFVIVTILFITTEWGINGRLI